MPGEAIFWGFTAPLLLALILFLAVGTYRFVLFLTPKPVIMLSDNAFEALLARVAQMAAAPIESLVQPSWTRWPDTLDRGARLPEAARIHLQSIGLPPAADGAMAAFKPGLVQGSDDGFVLGDDGDHSIIVDAAGAVLLLEGESGEEGQGFCFLNASVPQFAHVLAIMLEAWPAADGMSADQRTRFHTTLWHALSEIDEEMAKRSPSYWPAILSELLG